MLWIHGDSHLLNEMTGSDGSACAATVPGGKSPAAVHRRLQNSLGVRPALRAMRKEGGAYFYTEDNKPVPFDEVDRRISTGEVEGLKAIGLHLQDWKPQTKLKTSDGGDSASIPTPSLEPAPKEKRY